jgi:hypothetical protein
MARRPFVALSGRAIPDGQVGGAPAPPNPEIIELHMQMLANHIVSECRRFGKAPLALGLHVSQEPCMWHVVDGANNPRGWPSGTGQLEWDTTRYPDVDTALYAAMQRVMAGEK